MTDDIAGSAQLTYAVVYQLGKVASTSTVALLNQLAHVEAVQSHFLGQVALQKILAQVINPETSEYFHFHQRGQFLRNLDITRRMNLLRADKVPNERLLLISCTRDPMNWFRSAFTQDIAGYLPALRDVAADMTDVDATDDDAIIRAVVPDLLTSFSSVLTTLGGVDRTVSALALPGFHADLAKGVWFHRRLKDIFILMTRPFNWFEMHHNKALDQTFSDYTKTNGYWACQEGPSNFAILKYETLEDSLRSLIENLGLGPMPSLPRENTSDAKDHAEALSEIFATPASDALRAQFATSAYAQRFGYS